MSHSVPTALGPPLLASEAVSGTVRLRFGHHFCDVRLELSSGLNVLRTCQGAGETRPRSALTGSMLPTTLWEMSPCEVAESVIGRPQNTSSVPRALRPWTCRPDHPGRWLFYLIPPVRGPRSDGHGPVKKSRWVFKHVSWRGLKTRPSSCSGTAKSLLTDTCDVLLR